MPRSCRAAADRGRGMMRRMATSPKRKVAKARKRTASTLRKLVEGAAPDATASIKWGMPFYSVGSQMMCALAGHRSHVNVILAGPPGTFADPGGLLEGEGKTGRHLELRTLDELPREAVRGWLRKAAEVARAKGAGR
jgi:hypothetical protein